MKYLTRQAPWSYDALMQVDVDGLARASFIATGRKRAAEQARSSKYPAETVSGLGLIRDAE